ncbi:MAG: SUMF1/EgtB/PvdO family nonheme iron enzyme [Neomegalonema sp.]|nr:SUMF1/EgtB/PvdO family nonheme iron enzyme [Neomegalonema sp.]
MIRWKTVGAGAAALMALALGLAGLVERPWAETPPRRIALVIGNGAYTGKHLAALPNPVRDATAVEAMLKGLKFDEVVLKTDLTTAQMRKALRELGKSVRRGKVEIAAVFFAGHAIQYRGENYLFGVDAAPETVEDLSEMAVSLRKILDRLRGARGGLKLVMLDACRDEATLLTAMKAQETDLTRSASLKRGLTRLTDYRAEDDTLIAYATSPNEVALDGAPGTHSPFTRALLDLAPRRGEEIRLLFGKVRDRVARATGGRQKPTAKTDTMGGRAYFLAGAPAAPDPGTPGPVKPGPVKPAPGKPDPVTVGPAKPSGPSAGSARSDWLRTRLSEDPADMMAFRARWPESRFAGAAAKRFAELVARATDIDALRALRRRYPTEVKALSARILALFQAALAKAKAQRTIAALEAFRRRWPSSPVDAAAKAAIEALYTDLAAAQTALKRLGLYDGAEDGLWLESSAAALKKFEAALGLPADGVLSSADLKRLRGPTPVLFSQDLASAQDCAACPEMVAIPAGSFLMGSPETELERKKREGPQRRVAIKRFAIGKYEITFEQWDRCAAEGYCRSNPKPGDEGWGRGKRPVINVSWKDITGAGGFLDWLNSKVPGSPYRLPSEAEWEYATRAGTTGPFSFTGKISADKANYYSQISYAGSPTGGYRKKTLPVGSFAANPWGLHDVHGNVWEWVQDCWHGSYRGAPTDGSAWMAVGKGDCSSAVLRGGSWNYNPDWLRSAVRSGYPRGDRGRYRGFRVARTIIPS